MSMVGMLCEELRPLKRPKLGIPDLFPQESRQREDELTISTLSYGFRQYPAFGDETGSALPEIQHLVRSGDFTSRISQIMEAKKRTAWGQDSQKRRIQLSRENFWPVPVGRNKKEQASSWFQDLAGSKPLDQMAKKVPVFNKREETFDSLFEKDVPVFRAVWYIKMTAAQSLLGVDKLTKKKQLTDPSFEWTVSLTKYMQECVWRICNDSHRYDYHSSGNTSGSTSQSPIEEGTTVELSRWKYMMDLSSWLYQENLLDRQEFLRWLVERIENSKPSDDKSTVLYLPMTLKYLKDISECVFLARPLVTFCCQKFAHLFEMQQKLMLHSTRKDPATTSSSHSTESMEIGEEDEVFNNSTGFVPKPRATRNESHRRSLAETSETNEDGGSTKSRKRSRSGSITQLPDPAAASGPAAGQSNSGSVDKERKDVEDHACKHHTSMLLQLSCIIQTLAINCPTAFIHINISGKASGPSREPGPRGSTPLDKLPLPLAKMPLPKRGIVGVEQKLMTALSAAESEIRQRTKAAEMGWSTVAMADFRTSNKGSTVQQVLVILDVLNVHQYMSCKSHSCLTTLYARIMNKQRKAEVPLSSEALCKLLCQWAVTQHRHGRHRPLVTARIIRLLQNNLVEPSGFDYPLNLDALDNVWDQPTFPTSNDISSFPFQEILFQFLDTRAPLPEDLSRPLKPAEPFKLLLILFSELIHLGVFSYSLYLSTLVARGETKHPIVPLLPLFRGDTLAEVEPEEELSLPISFPTLPSLTFGSNSPQKRQILIKQEISPSLPPAFGSLLATPLDNPPSTSGFEESIKVEENTALMIERKNKLELLTCVSAVTDDSTQLISPLGFNSPSHDEDPVSPTKPDPFNFSLSFLGGGTSSPTPDDIRGALPSKIDKHASRHLLFATYFPVDHSEISQQERSVVLCGTGRTRAGVEGIVREIHQNIEHHFRLLANITSPVPPDPKLPDLLHRFCMLPAFEQNVIAGSCAQVLMQRLDRGSGVMGPTSCYPSCAELVFVCQLLEIAGSVRQIIELLINVMASNVGERREMYDKRQGSLAAQMLPVDLRIPIVNMLWCYLPCVLLSVHDTCVVFESLFYGILEGLIKPSEVHPTQKGAFILLHHLYTNCFFIRCTYQNLFGTYCVKFFDLISDYNIPTVVDFPWQQTIIPGLLSKPSECNVFQVLSLIRSTPKLSFFFVCEVFSIVCQKQTNLQTLSDLANVCASVACIYSSVGSELLGACRALCIPSTTYRACNTGYSHLTSKTDILKDRRIHSNLVTFMGLLLAYNCLTLHDIITYIIKPIFKVYLLYPQGTGNSHNGCISLDFVSILIRHLLVDEYIEGWHANSSSPSISLPPFVQHFLLSRSQRLSFDTVINLLKDLLKICKDSLGSSRGTTFGSAKTGMSIVVESFPSGSEGNEETLLELRQTLELLASRSWVREQCSQQASKQLLESDRLGDTSLTPPQAQYLLNLLIPYCPKDTPNTITAADGTLPPHIMDPTIGMKRIIQNLDQWTLRSALLHLEVLINETAKQHGAPLLDHLAQCVIQVFEDSCGDEWLGQTIDSSDENADGAFSPSIWLVTPLVSRLPKAVLGRILKNAGNVLGRGQWWNLERSQEKRRATRASSVIPRPKTGLQWQQPFLELVLACMHSHHSNHEELLIPLQKQLTTFLAAFEKEGMPSDEQSKAMLYASLKLRLSLVGSMLSSICVSESAVLDWTSLLMQLICSGAMDKQPDNSELFSNCLDMLGALMQALPYDFHVCMVNGGEEGKKTHTSCIKKMKMDLNSSKSSCKREIQQLFSLPQKAYEVPIIRPPPFTQPGRHNERLTGLRVQDIKEISPWEILEGIRNSGPLQPSWFGAVRMKRRPLRYLEQRKLVHFHTHQSTNESISTSPYSVSLPEPSSADNYTPDGDRIPVGTPTGPPMVVVASSVEDVKPPPVLTTRADRSFACPGNPPVAPPVSVVPAPSSLPEQKREMLDKIKQEQLRRIRDVGDSAHLNPVPSIMIQPQAQSQRSGGEGMAPGMPGSHQINQVPNPGIAANNQVSINQAAAMNHQYRMVMHSMTAEQRNHLSTLPPDQRKHQFMLIRNRIQQQQRMLELHRMQQQQQHQQQRVAMMPSGGGHMGAFRQPMAHGPQHMGPMQANPPMPMQQVMQQQQQRQMAAPGFPPGMGQIGIPQQQQQQLFMRSHQQMYVRPQVPAPMYPGMQPRHPGYYN